MRTFSDFDGTWTDFPEIWGEVQAIITGNSWQQYQKVMDDWVGPRIPVFFNPTDAKDHTLLGIVNHKANIINICNVEKFYEDESEQVSMLKIMCPNTRVIQVEKNTFAF